MGLQPGRTNNPKGRPAGSQNKATKSLREFMSDFLNLNRKKLQSDFNKLTAKDRLILFEKFLSFALPKMNNVQIEHLSDDNLDSIIEQLKNVSDEQE
jgi:hypothetical protein